MSPRKYQDSEVTMKAHLSINKESHMIQKCHNENPKSTKRPVIIYTQTPTVIHVEPHEFMALVQKLTGMPHPTDENPVVKEEENSIKDCGGVKNNVGYGENEAPSTSINVAQMKESCSYLNMDAPIFTNDLFYSSRPNSSLQSSSMNAISPSILDYFG